MSRPELKARARRFPDELLTQGDLAVADEVFARRVVHHGPISDGDGVGGIKRLVLALRRAFPDLCATVEDEIAEGDRVVQRLTLSGTHRGEYCGLLPTGRRATWELVSVHRVRSDGKIVEHWSSPDLYSLLCQLGALHTSSTAPKSGVAEETAP